MSPALYILHIVDDFGNQIPPYIFASEHLDAYMNRYGFFKENNGY
jgi:hypothetical protein